MNIEKLTIENKELISLWRYEGEYSGFNYALEKDGWLDSYCTRDSKSCFIAKKNSEIIGVFFFIEENENEFRILINPGFLNKGYGKTITSKAIDLGFKELLFTKISLIVRKNHPVAIKLYEKLGFKITGETNEKINNENIEFFKMKKSINS
ncbi:GNAT family N-acetyltransferase [Sulfurimonas sp.]|uniref:GNAT family N-acetyltransferase n=1 Tax=Sulfurimonas sp. TaxID=2022749 RepID=UPI002AB132DF|nr:GNAT family N-acetyltransferase [Sulfurimonas sp.]